MQELIAVNIVIGDRTYRVKIKPEDEEGLRKTVKVINDKILEFKTNFAGKDMQDYIAMVMVWYATQQPSVAAPPTLPEATLSALADIEAQLQQMLEAGKR